MTKPLRLSIGIGLAGVVCAAIAAQLPPALAWLAAWTALGCLAVSAAYAWNRPGIFGKREGRISPWRALLFAPYLLALRLACAAMRRVRRAPIWSEVAPGLYVGARMRGRDLPPGVEWIVDLTCEFSEPPELRARPGYRCVPVLDGSHPPDPAALLGVLRELAGAKGGAIFHCDAGRGRAPTAAALALLARGVASDPAAALELVRKRRPGASPTRSDVRFVERVAAQLAAAPFAR